MKQVEKRRGFIINFLYIAIWAGIIYCALRYAMPLFMPFVIAFFIAFILKPLINLIAKKTPLPRTAIAIVVLALVYAILGTLIVFAGIRLVVALSEWFADLPGLYRLYIEPVLDNISHWFDDFVVAIDPAVTTFLESASQSLSNALSSIISSISSGAINFISSLASNVPWFIASFFLCIIASFFFVIDYYKITSFLLRQLSAETKRRVFVIKDYVVNVLFRFARAYLILMGATFVEAGVGLLVLQVPNALLIAFLIAFVDLLPVFGTGAVMIPWILYSLAVGNYSLGLGLAVLYAIITVVRQFLEPRVVGKQIGLYPLLTLICMFIGLRMFGFWGMLGFPVAVTVLVHLNREGEIHLFREPEENPPPEEDAPDPLVEEDPFENGEAPPSEGSREDKHGS